LGFERNKKFTGRDYLLDQLDLALKPLDRHSYKAIVLYGTGGIGKTEVAIEYAYRHQKDFDSIFWVDATSLSTIHRSLKEAARRIIRHYKKGYRMEDPDYTKIAAELHLESLIDKSGSVANSNDVQVKKAIMDWFTKEGNHRWLLIFDNYDDTNSFAIHDFFPSRSQQSIIVTSRRTDFGRYRSGIEVKDLSPDEGLQLLKESANLPELSPEGM